MIDLAAYFARLGLAPPATRSRAALDAIALAHVRAIPFENLDVLLGRGISLDLAAIEAKLVHGGRGGYCFEHNTLLLAVLQQLGYAARPLSARVRIGRPRDMTPPRTHVFVEVLLDDAPLLVDVGVGALSPTATLRLDTDAEQATPHEPRRVIAWDGRRLHQACFAGEWHDVCEFTGEEMPPIDREVANWFTSAHPQSHFRGRLIVARALDAGRRLTLADTDLTERSPDGATHHRLASHAELLDVLRTRFDLRLADDIRLPCPGLPT